MLSYAFTNWIRHRCFFHSIDQTNWKISVNHLDEIIEKKGRKQKRTVTCLTFYLNASRHNPINFKLICWPRKLCSVQIAPKREKMSHFYLSRFHSTEIERRWQINEFDSTDQFQFNDEISAGVEQVKIRFHSFEWMKVFFFLFRMNNESIDAERVLLETMRLERRDDDISKTEKWELYWLRWPKSFVFHFMYLSSSMMKERCESFSRIEWMMSNGEALKRRSIVIRKYSNNWKFDA